MFKIWAGIAHGIATRYGGRRSAERIPVGAKFSAPIQTGPGARPASYGKGTLVACSRVNFTFTLLIRKAF